MELNNPMDNLNKYSDPNDLREWEPYVNQLSINKEFQINPYPSNITKVSQLVEANRKVQVITSTAIYKMMAGD